MSRTLQASITVLAAVGIAVGVAACGSENEIGTDSSATAVTPPTSRSVPVVPGPKPRTSNTVDPTSESVSADGDKTCGPSKGPDGAVYIHIVEGDLSCDTARDIAKQYGPLISTGAPQNISGWDCAQSSVEGELSRCTRGRQAFALKFE